MSKNGAPDFTSKVCRLAVSVRHYYLRAVDEEQIIRERRHGSLTTRVGMRPPAA
jgi:hypothetical protein